jgi:hypothetical protein
LPTPCAGLGNRRSGSVVAALEPSYRDFRACRRTWNEQISFTIVPHLDLLALFVKRPLVHVLERRGERREQPETSLARPLNFQIVKKA